jgi:Holliday junction resolvasome RuvABC endonuclease subunit
MGRSIPPPNVTSKTMLCLDLGTTTGWALLTSSHAGFSLLSGAWDFRPGRFDGAGRRYVRFRSQLIELLSSVPVDVVYFEEVRRHVGADAARVYGALFGVVTGLCEERVIPYEGVPVGTIKRSWTGKGNASKDLMIEEAHSRGYTSSDDNEVDAIALAHFAYDRDVDSDAPVEPTVVGVLS